MTIQICLYVFSTSNIVTQHEELIVYSQKHNRSETYTASRYTVLCMVIVIYYALTHSMGEN